jgi:endonuclease YncB( thermonuclease family)
MRPIHQTLRATAIVLLCAAAAPRACNAEPPVLVGQVLNVIDGDTIAVQLSSGPIRVRFDSIDAPEMDQPWGPEARSRLAARIDRREVALSVTAQDQYERLVAVVYLGDEEMNGWMLRQGHAWAYRDHLADDRYCRWEANARSQALGLWGSPASGPHAPWEWRHTQRGTLAPMAHYRNETVEHCLATARRPARASDGVLLASNEPPTASSPKKCLIKGNISDNGRIYHVPGSRWYDKTVIDPTRGERWFCTEKEARDAGWRPPKG